MDEILKLENISQYNSIRGVDTFHPLVSVIDMSKARATQSARIHFGFYCVFLKEIKCGDLIYGCNYYDYQEGTLVAHKLVPSFM
jgi:AraC family transcriptional activator of pobA